MSNNFTVTISEKLYRNCDFLKKDDTIVYERNVTIILQCSDIVTVKLFEVSLEYLYNNLVQVNGACI